VFAPKSAAEGQLDASAETASIFSEIVANAVAATGARFALMVKAERASETLHIVAWAGLDTDVMRQALAAARQISPWFDPARVSIPYKLSPLLQACFSEGTPFSAPLAVASKGVADQRIIAIARRIGGIHHVYCTPLLVGGEVVGGLSFQMPRAPTRSETQTCEAFARQAALTLENAALLQSLGEQIAELERSRRQITAAEEGLRREIAELLHGRVQTRLLVAWHRLGQCVAMVDAQPQRARELIAEVRDEIDRIREHEIRQASHLLHPAIIQIGLVPAVRSLASSFEQHFQIDLQIDQTALDLDDPTHNSLPEVIRLTAYRVIEEALNNAVRHAAATRLQVRLHINDGRYLEITVEDNGQGLDPSAVTAGLGLGSIAARVGLLGGTWRLSGAPGRGASLTALLPLTTPPP
jgi:signal transduction histidine kinase